MEDILICIVFTAFCGAMFGRVALVLVGAVSVLSLAFPLVHWGVLLIIVPVAWIACSIFSNVTDHL